MTSYPPPNTDRGRAWLEGMIIKASEEADRKRHADKPKPKVRPRHEAEPMPQADPLREARLRDRKLALQEQYLELQLREMGKHERT